MGKKSSPKAPDYEAAAKATAEGNKEALMYQTDANRANQITPWGTEGWFGEPGTPGYGKVTSLSANQQAIFDAQEQAQYQNQLLGLGLGDRLQQDLHRPDDFYNMLPEVGRNPNVPTYGQGLTDMGQGGQMMQMSDKLESAYDPAFAEQAFARAKSLIDPTHGQQLESQEVALRNQGLTPGTEAYDNALSMLRGQQSEQLNNMAYDSIDRGRAEQQAEFGRAAQANEQNFGQQSSMFGAGQQRGQYADAQRQQQVQEQMGFGQLGFGQEMQQSQYQQMLRQAAITEQQQREIGGLNLRNAAQSGQQVGMPNMPGYNQAGYVGGPDLLGAAQAKGQFDLQADAQKGPGLFDTLGGLGASYLGAR